MKNICTLRSVKVSLLICFLALFAAAQRLDSQTITNGVGVTITVTNTNDSGAGSLRQAIADAVSGDTINFSVTGTITLTSGQLSIGKNLTIQGPGANLLSISGNNASRVFHTYSSLFASLEGITIRNGADDFSDCCF